MGLTSNIHFINIKDFSHLSFESKNNKKKKRKIQINYQNNKFIRLEGH